MPLLVRAKDWKFRRNVDGKPVTDAVPVSPDDPVGAVSYVREHFAPDFEPSQRWLDSWLPVETSAVEIVPPGEPDNVDRTEPEQVRQDNMRVLMSERDSAEHSKDRIAAAKELNRMLRDNEARKPPQTVTEEELAELIHKTIGRQMGLVK